MSFIEKKNIYEKISLKQFLFNKIYATFRKERSITVIKNFPIENCYRQQLSKHFPKTIITDESYRKISQRNLLLINFINGIVNKNNYQTFP